VPSDVVATDAQICAAVDGDLAALEKLLVGFFPTLERHVEQRIPVEIRRHLSAEDILQEVFVQAFRDIGQLQHRNRASFMAWLVTIAEHRLADAIKRLGRKKRGGDLHQVAHFSTNSTSASVLLMDAIYQDHHLPDDSAARREMSIALQIALAALPAEQREVLRLRYLQHMDVAEIADQLGRTTGAVRGLIDRGKKRLADAMGRSSLWFDAH
jgi:RNA polymerase sigma-70 factor (ECF subfamily)